MATDNIFNQEKEKLNEVLLKVIDAKKGLQKSIESLGAVTLDQLQKLRADPEGGMDLVESLQRIQEKNEAFNLVDKYTRLEEMEHLKEEPYFSRIDLYDKGENKTNTYYIGKFGFIDENQPIITDWRAKVASVFYRYRYPQKEIRYDTPDGVETKDLTLKRTYEIDKGDLIKYYNNDIQLDENEIIVDKIEQRTGGVLEDIIETIQENQLDIIEADPRQVCIVQGTVGSGKSTVAIHKLSHIFFNYPKLIKANRAILIAKNQILVSYLSTLFPKLGIFDINYKTVKDLIIRIAFTEEMGLKFNFSEETNISDLNLEFVKQLRKSYLAIHDLYENKIDKIFEKDEFAVFGGYVYSRDQDVYSNVMEVISELNEEIGIQKESLEDALPPLRRELHKQNIKTLKKLVSTLRKLAGEINSKTFPALLKEMKIDPKEDLTYRHALLYLITYYELFGFKKFQKYDYCVVDEGQDFSVIEYLFLGQIIMNGRFCILGDLNQSYQEEGLLDWDTIAEVVDEAEHANTFELDTNYRSTKQIIDFANSILSPYTQDYLPKPINRMGVEPVIENYSSEEEVIEALKTHLENDTEDLNKSIGIICFSREYFERVERILEGLKIDKEQIVKLNKSKGINYQPRAIYLTMFEDCKGLEFSKVYNVGLNLGNVESFKDAKQAFVAVTRAMNEVLLLSN